MIDSHQTNPEKMHYTALAQGVKHYKKIGKGRENMCEAVERYARQYAKAHAEEYAEEYAKEYAVKEKIISVKNLMANMKLTLEQALDALGIKDDERETIIKEIEK